MKTDQTPILYIRLRKRIRLPKGKPILLGQIAQLLVEPEMEQRLKGIELYRPRETDGDLILVDMMLIVRRVKEIYPQIAIELFGEPHVLVEVYKKERKTNWFYVGIVWLLLFFGAGLAIMNFHVDVSMMEVHQRIAELVTGRKVEHPLWLQIPYSFGIGLGMVIFFNHIFKKKFSEEPTPLEVEMFMYQEHLNHYVITEEYRKLHDGRGGSIGGDASDKGTTAASVKSGDEQ